MRSNSIPAPVLTARVLHLHSSTLSLCLVSFQSLWAKPVPLHIPSCTRRESSVERLLCLFYLSIHPSVTPLLLAPLLPVSLYWQSSFLLLQSSWLIKLWKEGEQAMFSGLATLLWVHWLGLMLFMLHICSPGFMKRDGPGSLYETHNKGTSFIRQQSSEEWQLLGSSSYPSAACEC